MKYILLILLPLATFSCFNKNSKQEKFSNQNILNDGCALGYFSKIPDNYGLSGDYYSYDTTDLSENKYIFISDLTTSALIIINGIEIQLEPDASKCIVRKDDYYEDAWKCNEFEVILKLKVVKDEDEEIYCRGILEISTKDILFTFNIHGNSIT